MLELSASMLTAAEENNRQALLFCGEMKRCCAHTMWSTWLYIHRCFLFDRLLKLHLLYMSLLYVYTISKLVVWFPRSDFYLGQYIIWIIKSKTNRANWQEGGQLVSLSKYSETIRLPIILTGKIIQTQLHDCNSNDNYWIY